MTFVVVLLWFAGPQRLAATVLSLPVGLAGLSFTPDSLAVMVGELLLHKITADAQADAQADAAGCSAAGAGGRASGTGVRASGTGAAPADAGIGSSGAADTSGDAGGGGATSKGAALVSAWWSSRSRPDLEGCVYDFFMARCGQLLHAGNVTTVKHLQLQAC